MHRFCMTYDVVFAPEFHLPTCLGASVLTWQGLLPWFQKNAPTVTMGSAGNNNPLGITHDTGFLRPHVLVCVPDPTFLVSAGFSLLATATSSAKPLFCAHKSQVGVLGLSLPACADPIPYCITYFEGIVCSFPGLPTGLAIPTQISVFTGMTAGDIVGGIVNCIAESAYQCLLEGLGFGVGALATKGLAKVLPKVAPKVLTAIGEIIGEGPDAGLGLAASGTSNEGSNWSSGFENPGRVFQERIDGDGVGSDAHAAFRILGFGVTRAPEQGAADPSQQRSSGRFVHPFSDSPSADDS